MPKIPKQNLRALPAKQAEPDQLRELYKARAVHKCQCQISVHPEVMYGYYELGFAKSLAQTTSIQLAQAGANAATFKAPGYALSH